MRASVAIAVTVLLSLAVIAEGQDTLKTYNELSLKRLNDSVQASDYLKEARQYFASGNNDSSFSCVQRSVDLAAAIGSPLIEAGNYELLGSLYDRLSNWEETLLNYLKAASLYNRYHFSDREAVVFRTLAGKYYNMGIYERAASYYEQEFAFYPPDSIRTLAAASEAAALSWFYLPNDTMAVKWFQSATRFFEKNLDFEGVTRCVWKQATVYIRLGKYDLAMEKYSWLLNAFMEKNDYVNAASVYNNTGYLRCRLKDYSNAYNDFISASEYSKKAGEDPYFLTDVYSNLAICCQTMGRQKEMMQHFSDARVFADRSGREEEKARLDLLLSIIYFRNGDNYHAELYCQDCIETAKRSSAFDIMQECCLAYSKVLENGNDFVKALEYYEKYLNIRDSLNFESRLKEQNKVDRLEEYNSLEQRIRLSIADQEIQGLALKNLKAESSRKENELKLLLKQQELDRSEKDRLAQSLTLEKERYELAKREQEVRSLQQQQRYDSLQLKQKEDEALVLDRENRLLESEKQQQARDILKQKQIKRLAVGIGVLMVIVAIMILAGLISTRRKNEKLADSKRQIEKINADLEIKNREVLQQKDIIEQKNQAITDSIQYASRIQTAVLPPINFLTDWGIDNFILYKPKDIVSGDFFWGVKKRERVIVAAADCTGHGVPGAFMSMLGHAFLDEIMNTTEVNDAASILNLLRDEVINTLKQRGMVGEARDGMDISLCIIDRNKNKLDFAGANNPLYIIRNGKLIKVQADRMPIGIHVTTLTPFTNNDIELRKKDLLYLFSDGFADQFGGPMGKKFMYKPFQDLLIRIHSETLERQKEKLEKAFIDWMGDRDQVDDVLVIGMQL